jgi:GDP-L-fucose synthase
MIVITGGEGVLGRALQRHLHSLGRDFVSLSRKVVDLTDRDRCIAVISEIQPSIIFHLAAKVHGLGGNASFPAEIFEQNSRINLNVLEAARKSGSSKIVAVSTVAIYSSDVPKPTSEQSIWAGLPHHSEMAYGHAKRAMLAQLDAYEKQYGTKFCYPIMTNIYGPDDRFDPMYGHVIPSLVAKFHTAATTGAAVKVWGTGKAERDFLHSNDAARALVILGDTFCGPINVASGGVTKIRTIVGILSKISGVTNVCWDPSKPDGQLERSYDVSKLTELGFKTEVDLEAGLAETYNWYLQNVDNLRQQ